ncbi:hypothetical protein MalM25_23230 [Planctomycetes bacterium MalM25]|nr:hypothetical protein MalM25_23230 [Planctomycetes bacterium MalM25]
MTRLTTFAIVSLVALRLLTGWHFYNEGVKKLEPGFSSAGFLRAARGPLAPLFHSMVQGPYGAYDIFSEPHELGVRPADDPKPTDAWFQNIQAGWTKGLERLRIGGEAGEQLAALRDSHLEQVKRYLKEEELTKSIDEIQHEAWRLEQMKDEAGASPAPFQRDLIAEKESEVWGLMQPWVKTFEGLEADYIEEASALANEAGLGATKAKAALAEPTTLGRVDKIVTWTVLICGVCLFLGFATRIAAVVAAGFLFSLVMMQPPWAGVEIKEFFFWAIEIAAFLVIAALGAGRWAGLDGLLFAGRNTGAGAASSAAAKPAA